MWRPLADNIYSSFLNTTPSNPSSFGCSDKEQDEKQHCIVPKHHNGCMPRILHFIWLGSEMPLKYKDNIMKWKVMHPLWNHVSCILIVTYSDDKIDILRIYI